ncbi:hypothetical protein [Roseomonas xinghualingensis]|uniref:hypothetical protein n=1 Tax=Roseomonas xinghualingensis TaxID=2986475 RepID=UPI0021F0C14B|nr:hypothetical protein [Roseomonas sp. SXEYE001]MCV4210411.1 hypothetical protein [Roseomonas sp. SXEYE001]
MSETLPADVVTSLLVNGVANRPQRVWAYESVPFEAQFRAGTGGPLMDVEGVSIAFLRPDSGEAIMPEGFLVRVAEGRYACRLVPALAGTWQAVARCTSPTASVAVRSFLVDALPAGTPPPPQTHVTDDSGLFLLLTADGAPVAIPGDAA